ncbi:MAG TPA: D-alanyl-D-alanine carboxypeptidase/D-alanyl-D-alanine-endopeptidase [Psychromonas hadalis]|nr:D-alanyl-D-alanine carboxypeptidase/D-alanyl-D-alanine-endopeptidase [Psychromonas hadalis]
MFSVASQQSLRWENLQTLIPKGTQVSYIVVDPKTKATIASHNAETLRTPASMQKLITATAAKLYLGSDFRYKTTIVGEKSKIKKGKYQGDLRFMFVGDPQLLRKDIKKMLVDLKNKGIRTINGNFILNASHFNGYQWSNGQAWNDLGVCYTAPSNAIIVNRNCVRGNLSLAKKEAKKATIFIPNYEPVNITADVDVVTKEERSAQFCALEVTRNSQNNYHLWGCMVPRNRPFGLAFAVNDPFEYAQQIVAKELKNIGIKLHGKVLLEKEPINSEKFTVLVEHQSPRLEALLSIMMKKSDNLIADSLFKTLGSAYFKTSGNFRNGQQAVKRILKQHGVDLENSYLADGSGLSRHNLMSAELFMNLLTYVYENDARLDLLSRFSIAGVDGTLKYHKGVKGEKFKGKIIAKTGSLKGVANLLGVAKTDQGDKLFVVIINGYNRATHQLTSALPRTKKESKDTFEQAFFSEIFK